MEAEVVDLKPFFFFSIASYTIIFPLNIALAVPQTSDMLFHFGLVQNVFYFPYG